MFGWKTILWAPLVCTLLLLAMAPYCDPPCVVLSGCALLLACLGAAAVLDVGASSAWPPLAAASIIVSPVVFGTAGALAGTPQTRSADGGR